jgi:ribosomal protein S18 acetylase RimI-like enzyme
LKAITHRHPDQSELGDVRAFIQDVVNETYRGLWSEDSISIGESDWSRSWIVTEGNTIVGVVLTLEEWLEDLWIAKIHRSQGLGTQLLVRAELEIAQRGFEAAKLRVVSTNTRAIHFYESHGWHAEEKYPHEQFPIFMVKMRKRLVAVSQTTSHL